MTSRLEAAIRELVAERLVDPAAIVDGDLRAVSAARRNLSLKIERRRGRGFLIKRSASAAGAAGGLAAELRFYAFCSAEPRADVVARWMPRRLPGGGPEGALLLELLEGSRTLWQAYEAHGAPDLPLALPAALGQALAALHGTFRRDRLADDPRLGALEERCPSCCEMHRPHPGMLRDASPARLELCRAIQRDDAIRAGLEAARAGWRVETLLHGDVRSDNVLVPASGKDGAPLRLVDWELVQRGDPAWDLGCALHDHLLFWVRGMPPQPDLEAGARVAGARYPLEAVRAAMRSLWSGYLAGGGTPRPAALLGRSVSLAGARFLQTAWEGCRHLDRPSLLAALALQIAANVLADPGRAAGALFGLAGRADAPEDDG